MEKDESSDTDDLALGLAGVLIILFGLIIVSFTLTAFYSAAAIKTSPDAVVSVSETNQSDATHEVHIISPAPDSITVEVTGVENRTLEEGGESFTVTLDENSTLRIIEKYNPNTPVFNKYYKSEYVLYEWPTAN